MPSTILFVGSGAFDFSHLTKDFGTPWELASSDMFLKAYPCCGSTHVAVEAILGLRKAHHLLPEGIDYIEAIVRPIGASSGASLGQTSLEGNLASNIASQRRPLRETSTPPFH